MKKIAIGILIIMSCVFTSCSKLNEEAPRQKGVQTDYILEPAQELSAQERLYIEERKAEYKKLLNN